MWTNINNCNLHQPDFLSGSSDNTCGAATINSSHIAPYEQCNGGFSCQKFQGGLLFGALAEQQGLPVCSSCIIILPGAWYSSSLVLQKQGAVPQVDGHKSIQQLSEQFLPPWPSASAPTLTAASPPGVAVAACGCLSSVFVLSGYVCALRLIVLVWGVWHAGGTGEFTDYYLYITAHQDEHCASGAVAWALPCLYDTTTNRPLLGSANICPNVSGMDRALRGQCAVGIAAVLSDSSGGRRRAQQASGATAQHQNPTECACV